MGQRDHWSENARRWALIGPPLRPSPGDVAIAARVVGDVVAGLVAGPGVRRGLVLGVTPELVGLAWPAGAAVIAVDRMRPMIDAVFPPGPGRHAVLGDWLALPLAADACDVALGDGCLTTLPFPDGYRAFARELARVTTGPIALRTFLPPPRPETISEIVASLPAADGDATPTFDAVRWRFVAACAVDRHARVADVRAAFDAALPDRAALAARTGWRREVIDQIDVYRDSPARYALPTLAEVRAVLGEVLVEVATLAGPHPQFPTVVWRRR